MSLTKNQKMAQLFFCNRVQGTTCQYSNKHKHKSDNHNPS